MTAHTIETVDQQQYPLHDMLHRTMERATRFGSGVCRTVANTNLAAETWFTKLGSDRTELTLAAHRGDIAPQIRDRLLAQHAIDSLIKTD